MDDPAFQNGVNGPAFHNCVNGPAFQNGMDGSALQNGMNNPDPALQNGLDSLDPVLQNGMNSPDHVLQNGLDSPDPALQNGVDSPDPALQNVPGSPDQQRYPDNAVRHGMSESFEKWFTVADGEKRLILNPASIQSERVSETDELLCISEADQVRTWGSEADQVHTWSSQYDLCDVVHYGLETIPEEESSDTSDMEPVSLEMSSFEMGYDEMRPGRQIGSSDDEEICVVIDQKKTISNNLVTEDVSKVTFASKRNCAISECTMSQEELDLLAEDMVNLAEEIATAEGAMSSLVPDGGELSPFHLGAGGQQQVTVGTCEAVEARFTVPGNGAGRRERSGDEDKNGACVQPALYPVVSHALGTSLRADGRLEVSRVEAEQRDVDVATQCSAGAGGEQWQPLSDGAGRRYFTSCEDFQNLDRRIESLTFDFEEEEERGLQLVQQDPETYLERQRLFDELLDLLAEYHRLHPVEDSDALRRYCSDSDLCSHRPAVLPPVNTYCAAMAGDRAGPQLAGHSVENLSEDSGYGDRASPPDGTGNHQHVRRLPKSFNGCSSGWNSGLRRRTISTPDLSPGSQRRHRLWALISRDDVRRSRVYEDAPVSDAAVAVRSRSGEEPAASPEQLDSCDNGPVADRPVPAPRTAVSGTSAVYQNLPTTARLCQRGTDEVCADQREPCDPNSHLLHCVGIRFRSLSNPDFTDKMAEDWTQFVSSADEAERRPSADAFLAVGGASSEHPRDIYLSDREAEFVVYHRSGAGRPKPLDLQLAEEFLLLERAGAVDDHSEHGDTCTEDLHTPDNVDKRPNSPYSTPNVWDGNLQNGYKMETISLTSRSRSLADLSVELPDNQTTSSTHTVLYSDDPISANRSISNLPSVTSPVVGVTSSGDGPQEGAADACWSGPGRGGDDGGSACSEVNIVGQMGSRRPGAVIDSRLEREWLEASMEPQTVERHGHPSTVDSTANRVQRWPVKTYGTAANQVQVYIARQSAAPDRSALSSDGAPRRSKGRSVQLSPVVSEVKWRESYFEEDPGGGAAEPPRKPVPGVREVRRQPPAPTQRRDKTVQKVQVAYPVAGQWEGVVRHVMTSERRSVSPQPPPKPLVATNVSTRVASPDDSTLSPENDEVRNNNLLIITPAKEQAEKVKQKSLLKRLGFGKVTNGKSKSKSPTSPDSTGSPSLVSVSPQFHSEAVTSTPLMAPRTNSSDDARVDGVVSFEYKHPPAASSVTAPRTPEARYGSRYRTPEVRHGSHDRTPEVRHGSRDRTPEVGHGSHDRTPEVRHGSRDRTPEVRHGSRDRTMRASQSPDRSVLQTSTSSGDRTIAGSPSAQKPPLPPQAIPKLQCQASKMRLHNARRSFLNTNQAPAKTPVLETPPSQPPGTSDVVDIKEAFEKFRQRARQERERLAKSSPDLSVIEKTTRGSVQRLKTPQSQGQQQPAAVRSPQPRRDVEQAFRAARSRVPAPRRAASRDQPLYQETSLDGGSVQPAVVAVSAADRAKSMVHLPSDDVGDDPRTMKSLEFLLDDQNKAATLPPENQLSRTGCRLSEHQLRFQRSLRNLHVPDWYRRSYRAEASLKRHYSLGSSQVGGWSGFNSKSTSKESLHSTWSAHSGGVPQQQPQKLVIPTRVPLPPRRHTNSGGSGWSGGSTASTSPPCSPPGDWQRGSRPGSSRFQQPYLGWRSKERLNGGYPTPAERLASSVSSDSSAAPRRPPQPELQDSIREVTNAIVHYFDGGPTTGSGGVWRETAFLDRTRSANPTSPQHPTPSRRLQTRQYQIEDAVFV